MKPAPTIKPLQDRAEVHQCRLNAAVVRHVNAFIKSSVNASEVIFMYNM